VLSFDFGGSEEGEKKNRAKNPVGGQRIVKKNQKSGEGKNLHKLVCAETTDTNSQKKCFYTVLTSFFGKGATSGGKWGNSLLSSKTMHLWEWGHSLQTDAHSYGQSVHGRIHTLC